MSPSDASTTSNPLSEEKVDFDDLSLHHDEIGLNPIDDVEDLERFLKTQNRGCCDTTVEATFKALKIPEPVIEHLLCQADKAFCTVETTTWMSKKTGIDFCGADDLTVVSIEEERSKAGTAADGSVCVSANDVSIAVVSVEGEESAKDSSSASVQAKDESVALASDEDANVSEENLDASAAAKGESVVSPTTDAEDAAKVSEERLAEEEAAAKAAAEAEAQRLAEEEAVAKAAAEAEAMRLAEEEAAAKAAAEAEAMILAEEAAAAKAAAEAEAMRLAEEEAAVKATAEAEAMRLAEEEAAVKAAAEAEAMRLAEEEAVASSTTTNGDDAAKIEDESNVDTSGTSGLSSFVTLLSDSFNNAMGESVESSEPIPETYCLERGFECVLDSDVGGEDTSAEHEEAIKFPPKLPKKRKKIRPSKLARKLSARISKLSPRKNKKKSKDEDTVEVSI